MKLKILLPIIFVSLLCMFSVFFQFSKWDKVFPKSDKVVVKKISFHNRYGIKLVGDLYVPKDKKNEKLPAIAITGPFGAVKEQSSGLYAQTLAERGFITLAFDPSYTGESGGKPRNVASPDINTEDISASVDYLLTLDAVDENKIGVIGICGFGGFALNVGSMDTRIKAISTITMYDMTRVNANGYFDGINAEQRYEILKGLNEQRTKDYKNNTYDITEGLPNELKGDEVWFVKEYFDFYKTKRGFHKRSINSNSGWVKTTALGLINAPILVRSDEIRMPVLMIHGEKAHSRYFSEDAFKKLKGDNKELYIVPDATHVDLYDQKNNKIPFDKIEKFFKNNLK